MHRQPLCAARSPGIMVCLRRAAAHETRKLRVLSVLCFFVHELYNIFEPAESLLTSCPLLFLLLEILHRQVAHRTQHEADITSSPGKGESLTQLGAIEPLTCDEPSPAELHLVRPRSAAV